MQIEQIGPPLDEKGQEKLMKYVGKGIVGAYVEFMKKYNGALIDDLIVKMPIDEDDRKIRIANLEDSLRMMDEIKSFSPSIHDRQKHRMQILLENAKNETECEYEIVKIFPFADQIDGLENVNNQWKDIISLVSGRKLLLIGEDDKALMLCLDKKTGNLYLIDPDCVGNNDDGIIDIKKTISGLLAE